MSNTPGDHHLDGDDDPVEQFELARPEQQRGGTAGPSDDSPSATDLDEREANRSSSRKAAGPGGARGARRAGRMASPPPSAPSDGTPPAGAPPVRPERRRSPETHVEP